MAIIFTIKITESLAHNLQALLDAPIIELDVIDSTNNYAMRLIDADTAQAGLTVVARQQTDGKGQRGKSWQDMPGESLLCSVIVYPERAIEEQFVFNANTAVAIAEVLSGLYENWDVRIKWPNDIIINDKKAGGVLIENVLRGSNWSFSIIGLGLNVGQTEFPGALPFATSLRLGSGKNFSTAELLRRIREEIFRRSIVVRPAEEVMEEYNSYLYRRGHEQGFTDGSQEWRAIIKSAGSNGKLTVQLADGSVLHYNHGAAIWKWE